MLPFEGCKGFANMGYCNPKIAELSGMPEFFGDSACCESCQGKADKCSDHADLIAEVVGGLPNAVDSIETCGDIQGVVGGDLCADDSAIGALAAQADIDWETGTFKIICCRFCDPPAAVVKTVVPASTSIVLTTIPAQGSAEEKVLVAGLTKVLTKAVKNSNPDAEVKITSFNGQAVDGRRLAEASVEFDIILPTMCSTDECTEKPSAGDAENMANDVNSVLVEVIASDNFAAELEESITVAAAELVAEGVISSDEAEAAKTAIGEVTVNEPTLEEPVVGDKEDYVSPDGPTDDGDDGNDGDDDEESVDGSSSAVKVGSISVFVAAIVAMFM
jgi:hypothetical protein